MRRLLDLPILVLLMAITALSMWLPAVHGVVVRDHETARAFFYSGMILLILTGMIAIATANHRPRNPARTNLAALVAAYAILPLFMALPLAQALPDTRFGNAWFEMISAFTTTGATTYDPSRLPGSIHLWRAQVGWMGGFFILVAAVAILAPMNLGGIEVISGRVPGRGNDGLAQITRTADPARRVLRQAAEIFPAYAGLTLILWVILLMAGEGSLVALCHAMSTLSTSGISPLAGLSSGAAGLVGEMAIFAVMIAALSRRSWPGAALYDSNTRLRDDPELRLALVILLVLPAILLLRHWTAAQGDGVQEAVAAGRALWGAVFTTLSFLTTTGFTSADWNTAQGWSGLRTPGLVLAGLAIMGGGVATTAGGVKLLRVYALFRHGQRELERLVHPSSIGGAGQSARRLRREGAYLAWIFFMIFALTLAAVMAALTLAHVDFEAALVLTLAALTTAGPLAEFAASTPLSFGDQSLVVKAILGATMVIGRIEILAIFVLVTPDNWRR